MAAKKDQLQEFWDSGQLLMGDSPELDIHRLPTGIPQLDAIIGGGIAYGRNVLCVGPESTGKTIIAQYVVAAQQRQVERPKCVLVDTEMSYDKQWWSKSGVDTSKLMVSRPHSGEAAVDTIIGLLKGEPDLGCIVLDSIAGLAPTSILEKSAADNTMAALSRLVSNLYTRMMPINKHAIFFGINQLRANMKGYDDVYPGGEAQRFYSHLRLRTRRKDWIKEGEERVGQEIEVHAAKNKVGEPQGECTISMRFKDQLDLMASYIDEGLERKLITVGGPWYHFGGEKLMGRANLRLHFAENPAAFEALKGALSA